MTSLKLISLAACAFAWALGATGAAAQDRINVTLTDATRPAMLRVGVLNGSITVKGADVKDVAVEARVRAEEERDRKSSGMRRIPIASTGLTVEEENNDVRVGTGDSQRTVDLTITVPRKTNVRLRATNDGNIVVSGIEGEIDVNNTNGAVAITNVSGTVVAHALNDDIKVVLNRVSGKAMAFSSLNGDIDVTFPADLKANILFKSDGGEVYSDFDVTLLSSPSQQIVEDGRGKGGKYRVKTDKTVRGTINGGGPEIQFTNFNGNIYIRKAGGSTGKD